MSTTIQEGNISDQERQYRNFCGVVSAYKPGIDTSKISVEKTSKGNWNVYDDSDTKVCLISKRILSDELANVKNIIRKIEDPV